MLLKIFLWLAKKLFHKTFAVGSNTIYGMTMIKKGMAYFYPSGLSYGKPSTDAMSFSEYDITRYAEGGMPTAFLCPEHAEEAAKRMLKVLRDYHEELGY